jgi:succinyl-diaminopimelate desuccinylase
MLLAPIWCELLSELHKGGNVPLDPLELAQTLLRFPSLTPDTSGALDYCQSVLTTLGFSVTRLPFGEGDARVDNLYARWGASTAPRLLFAGHTDVVPEGDPALWRHDPFGGIVDGDFLFGRGAVDMKGAVACMLVAFSQTVPTLDPEKISLGMLLTGDEEGVAINGTVRVLEWMAATHETFAACVLGEPTNGAALSDAIKIGRRGSLTGRITIRGTQGHVAYPERAKNPIPLLVVALHTLQTLVLDQGTEHFAPSNLEITTVDVGNSASNVIPFEARAVFNIRFNDQWTANTLAAHVQAAVPKAIIDWQPSNAPAFLTPPERFHALVTDAVEAHTRKRPSFSTSGGTSDARFLQKHGTVLEYGLVGTTMHQIDERVAVADLYSLSAIYADVIQRWGIEKHA